MHILHVETGKEHIRPSSPFIIRTLYSFILSCNLQYLVWVSTLWTINDNGAPHSVTGAFPYKWTWDHYAWHFWICPHNNLEATLLQDASEGESHGLNSDFNSFGSYNGGIVYGYGLTNIGNSSSENTCCWILLVFQAKLHCGIVEGIIAKSRNDFGTVYVLRTN